MDKIDFAKKEPTLCKIQLFFKVLLPQDRIDNWVHPGKICLGHSISQKFCIRKSQKECLSKERYFKFQATRIKIKHTVRLPDLLRVLAQQSSPTMMCEHAMRRKKKSSWMAPLYRLMSLGFQKTIKVGYIASSSYIFEVPYHESAKYKSSF